VDIPRATNLLQIIIGAGGAPGGSSGANGASCQVIATGASTLIGTGGVGGVRGESKTGRSPGNHIHNGVPYVGGAAQFSSGPGNPPGGGGPGASSFFMSPEAGAPGAVWVVFRQ
jgi:hypothetical protein